MAGCMVGSDSSWSKMCAQCTDVAICPKQALQWGSRLPSLLPHQQKVSGAASHNLHNSTRTGPHLFMRGEPGHRPSPEIQLPYLHKSSRVENLRSLTSERSKRGVTGHSRALGPVISAAAVPPSPPPTPLRARTCRREMLARWQCRFFVIRQATWDTHGRSLTTLPGCGAVGNVALLAWFHSLIPRVAGRCQPPRRQQPVQACLPLSAAALARQCLKASNHPARIPWQVAGRQRSDSTRRSWDNHGHAWTSRPQPHFWQARQAGLLTTWRILERFQQRRHRQRHG